MDDLPFGSDSGSDAPDAQFLAAFMPELPKLKAYLRVQLRRQTDVDDLMQEVALIVWRRFGDYDPERPFRPWLFGVARNVLRQHLRKRDERVLEFNETVHRTIEEVLSDDRVDDRNAMQNCLDKLDDRARQLLRQRYDEGLSLADMEQRTGKSLKAISKAIGRIRVSLSECLQRQLRVVDL